MKKDKHKIIEEDKKTLLKLVNQYADSFQSLDSENKKLKEEVSNLKATLRINKELVDQMINKRDHLGNAGNTIIFNNLNNNIAYSTVNTNISFKAEVNNDLSKDSKDLNYYCGKYDDEYYINLLNKINQENCLLQAQLKSINKNYDNLISTARMKEHNINEEICLLKEKNQKLQEDNFLVTNKLNEEENKRKAVLRSYQRADLAFIKEVYIIENFDKKILALTNELETLRKEYENLVEKYSIIKEKNYSLKELNEMLQSDNEILAKKVKLRTKRLNEYQKNEKYKPDINLNSSLIENYNERLNKMKSKYDIRQLELNSNRSIQNVDSPIKNNFISNIKIESFRLNAVELQNEYNNEYQNLGIEADEDSSVDNISIKKKNSNNLNRIKRISKRIIKTRKYTYNNLKQIGLGFDFKSLIYVENIWKEILFENGLNYKQLLVLHNFFCLEKLYKSINMFKKTFTKQVIEFNLVNQDNARLNEKINMIKEEIENLKKQNKNFENIIKDGLNSFKSPILGKKNSFNDQLSLDMYFLDEEIKISSCEQNKN
jgi:hypothetical protein